MNDVGFTLSCLLVHRCRIKSSQAIVLYKEIIPFSITVLHSHCIGPSPSHYWLLPPSTLTWLNVGTTSKTVDKYKNLLSFILLSAGGNRWNHPIVRDGSNKTHHQHKHKHSHEWNEDVLLCEHQVAENKKAQPTWIALWFHRLARIKMKKKKLFEMLFRLPSESECVLLESVLASAMLHRRSHGD